MILPAPTTYRIDEADHYALWKMMSRRSSLRSLGWSVLFVLLIGAFIAWDEQSVLDGLIPVSVGIMVGLAITGVLMATLRARSREVYEESASLKEEMTLTFTDEGFEVEQASGLYRAKWDTLVRWDENARIFAVFLNRQMAIIFPKAQVSEDVVDFAREQMKRSGLTRPRELRK